MAHLCNGDELCQGLAQEYPQVRGWLPAAPSPFLSFLSSLGSARGEGLETELVSGWGGMVGAEDAGFVHTGA